MIELRNLTLLLHDRILIRLDAEGPAAEVSDPEAPAAIARAARELLPPEIAGGSPLLLFLPPGRFLATPYELPGVQKNELVPALMLQRRRLVGIDEDMLVASDGDENGIALWFRVAEAEALYDAFADAGLLLAGLAPRPFCHPGPADGAIRLLDEDAAFVTLAEFRNGRLHSWQQLAREDLAQPEIGESWERELANEGGTPLSHFSEPAAWRMDSGRPETTAPAPRFIPPGAARLFENRRQRLRRQRLLIGGGALLLLILLPLLLLQGINGYLAARVAELRQANQETLTLQTEVAALEDEWAPVREFPDHRPAELLTRLDKLIPPDSWLTAFNAANGVIEIEGVSGNATRLLEILSAQPDFQDVAFSRAVKGGNKNDQKDQFGIRFRLKDFAAEAYLRKHFPPAR